MMGVRTKIEVEPAGMVAVVALTHVLPPSVETCKFVLVPLPKSVPSPVAVPFASVRLTTVLVAVGLDKVTLKTPYPPASDTLMLDTDKVGAGLLISIATVAVLKSPSLSVNVYVKLSVPV